MIVSIPISKEFSSEYSRTSSAKQTKIVLSIKSPPLLFNNNWFSNDSNGFIDLCIYLVVLNISYGFAEKSSLCSILYFLPILNL